ncbi:fimbrial protein [Morganella morganii]|uniref:fimbrial protein n=2 Tax=Morganella morganii TaxID=582 RepID=UPI000934638A|nr:fimbrial protein [Morganella morganii]HAS8352505.1 type 1 fimbrial protein [Vibrio vulnificus]
MESSEVYKSYIKDIDMNKLKLALLVAGALVAGVSTSASAFAPEGQGLVHFEGRLIDETCKITSQKEQTVTLKAASIKTLTKVGDEGGFEPFQIDVECPVPLSAATDPVKTVGIHFEPISETTDWDTSTGNLKNKLTDATGAKNVQIKIYDTTGGTRTHQKIGTTGTMVEPKGDGKMSFTYVGGYSAVGQTSVGLVKATVMYTLLYK